MIDPTPPRPPLNQKSLGQVLDLYLEHFALKVTTELRAPATLEMHRAHAELLRARLGELELGAVTTELLEELAASWKVSGGTIRKRLSTLAGALRFAHRRGLLEVVPPFPEIGYVYRPGRNHLRSWEEYSALCLALPLERAEWVAVAVFTGMHAADVNAWRAYTDADPFAEWMVLYNRKNRKSDGLRVRMPAELAVVLRARFRRERVRVDGPAVAPWPAGSRGHTLPVVSARLGLMHMNATALRHTCGTWMVRRKGITKAAQEWLGHSSPAMLARVYAHALPLQLEECSAELDSMEVEGVARLPPRKASRKRAPTQTSGGTAPGGIVLEDGSARAVGTGERGEFVPRDRVELSTHGFSVRSSADPSATRRPPRKAPPPDAARREPWKRKKDQG